MRVDGRAATYPYRNGRKRRSKEMTFKIVNAMCIPGVDYGEDLLRPFDAVLKSGKWPDETAIIDNAKDADALVCISPVQPITARVIRSLERCRIIASLAIGYDRIDLDAANEMGIAVTNTPDYCLDEVSNQAIALMMALSRKLFQIDKLVRSEQILITPPMRDAIREIAFPIPRLCSQTLGIIGLGKIGTASALKAKGLGMSVIAYDPYVFGPVMKTMGVEKVDLERLLKESDYISIHALLSDETRAMIGYDQFKAMKRTCYLINTARGDIVDECALVRALKEGLIAGAGLDATANEPFDKNDSLLEMPNVILTGHSAWYSTDSDSEFWRKAMTQVVMALRGEWPTYAVNPEAKNKWLRKWAV
ncbi:MAG: C-terminal binding protein [Desulfobacteraceae bacterium]|nr:MAG: C-terminal binding protein [Desulfobacteraceae bacterium]